MLAPSGEKVVLAHGCFDVLHLGHIRHLQEAAALGDSLVVSITADRFVNKGAGRPHFTEKERAEALMALNCVDSVIINHSPDAIDAINQIRPSIYVKGIDYADHDGEGLRREVAAIESIGGKFHVTSTDKWSSTRILNGEKFDDTTISYLESARKRDFLGSILKAFEAADKLKLCFVGERILDEYRYVTALGKPSKEFILATVETGEEFFFGGVQAAAAHCEWRQVRQLTAGPAIRKLRYVDQDFTRKIFEVYSHKRIELSGNQRDRFQSGLISEVRDADVVIVLDFGHGLMGAQERHFTEGAKFLAVNAQTNAGNYGFNPVTNYDTADYVCIDDPEARLATGMRYDAVDRVIEDGLAARIKAKNFAVTHGKFGSTTFNGERFAEIPAFTVRGIDTIGAGDAYLAASAPLLATGLELEAAAFAGNVAGAIKVSIVGHRRHVERQELVKTIEALLK